MDYAVVTTCSNRKTAAPSEGLEARSLAHGVMEYVASEWLTRLRSATPVCAAADLYAGRGFRYASRACQNGGPFVVSAGLGFLTPGQPVPSYGLTVAHGAEDDIFARIDGRRDPAAWWDRLSASPFRSPLRAAFAGGGLVLMALSAPYLAMIAQELRDLPPSDVERLRLFLPGKPRYIPVNVAPCLMPYDSRLESPSSPLRGPLIDFAPRALLHFTQYVLPETPSGATPSRHAEATDEILDAFDAPEPGGMRP